MFDLNTTLWTRPLQINNVFGKNDFFFSTLNRCFSFFIGSLFSKGTEELSIYLFCSTHIVMCTFIILRMNAARKTSSHFLLACFKAIQEVVFRSETFKKDVSVNASFCSQALLLLGTNLKLDSVITGLNKSLDHYQFGLDLKQEPGLYLDMLSIYWELNK